MTTIQRVRPRLARKNTPALIEALGRDEFEGYASLFNVADGAGDIVAPGAFARSLKRRPPERVRMLYQHFAHEPIGVWEEIREDAKGLYVRGRLIGDVERAREVAALISKGALDGLSIGFRTIRAWKSRTSVTRTLLEIELWEISIVTFPLLEGSEVTGIGTKNSLAGGLRKASAAFGYRKRTIAPQPERGKTQT
jgi:HK97 family phage prohead protease